MRIGPTACDLVDDTQPLCPDVPGGAAGWRGSGGGMAAPAAVPVASGCSAAGAVSGGAAPAVAAATVAASAGAGAGSAQPATGGSTGYRALSRAALRFRVGCSRALDGPVGTRGLR